MTMRTFTAPGGTQFQDEPGAGTVYVAEMDGGVTIRHVEVPLADLLAFAERAAWVRCDERLPERGKYVWTYGRHALDGTAKLCDPDDEEMAWKYEAGGWAGAGDVTHWRELPAAPEEGR